MAASVGSSILSIYCYAAQHTHFWLLTFVCLYTVTECGNKTQKVLKQCTDFMALKNYSSLLRSV